MVADLRKVTTCAINTFSTRTRDSQRNKVWWCISVIWDAHIVITMTRHHTSCSQGKLSSGWKFTELHKKVNNRLKVYKEIIRKMRCAHCDHNDTPPHQLLSGKVVIRLKVHRSSQESWQQAQNRKLTGGLKFTKQHHKKVDRLKVHRKFTRKLSSPKQKAIFLAQISWFILCSHKRKIILVLMAWKG